MVELVNIPIPHDDPNGLPRYYITNGTTAILVTEEDMDNLISQITSATINLQTPTGQKIQQLIDRDNAVRSFFFLSHLATSRELTDQEPSPQAV